MTGRSALLLIRRVANGCAGFLRSVNKAIYIIMWLFVNSNNKTEVCRCKFSSSDNQGACTCAGMSMCMYM